MKGHGGFTAEAQRTQRGAEEGKLPSAMDLSASPRPLRLCGKSETFAAE